MALPVTFAGLTSAAFSQLDQNFAALGAEVVIPCTISGTYALTFTPAANSPAVNAYSQAVFVGKITATNTLSTTVTVAVGALPALNVYKDTASGPTVLTGGELVQNNLMMVVYDASLNSGAGGWHLMLSNVVNSIVSVVTGTIATLSSTTIATNTQTISSSGGLTFLSQVNGSGTSAGTLTNAPVSGNPAFWLQTSINSSTYYIPCWT